MNTNQFAKYYSEESLWKKIIKYSKAAGTSIIYGVLLLYYVLKEDQVSTKTKLLIIAALGYFILPTDAIFDLTPLIGYSDDLGVLLFTLSQISSSITPGITEKARSKLADWFGEVKEAELKVLEDKIS
jgi:uncharacterized membrane protein YkvA (DUF1232 family)